MKSLIALPLILVAGIVWAENLDVLPDEIAPGVPKTRMMSVWLKEQAYEALDHRDAAFEQLKTPEDVAKWQQERRDFFVRQLGGFPKRTPLYPQVTGKRTFDDYRIEKVIFESQPGFHVTATLYLPLGAGPFPAVLHPTGHSSNAKARDLYQQASIVIAEGGCAVLCYDPLGQGERRHFFQENGKSRFASTQEHQLINQGCVLLGSNTARYMIWDGMRAIDYLQGRTDIDPKRIGCTGISGGGTNTSYLMALDDRIVSAAPGCYLTGFRALLSTIGLQDAEQNIHGQIAFGMDHADYVLMRAPQPTLIMAATHDYFDIEGAWRLFRQAKRTYTRLGFPERVDLVEPDTKHGFPTEMRLASANWMRRWLLDTNETVTEPDFQILADEELFCTPQGQVLKLAGARSAFDLNVEWNESFRAQREKNWKLENRKNALAKVRELIGVDMPDGRPKPTAETCGTIARNGYVIERLVIKSEPSIVLPALFFLPAALGDTDTGDKDAFAIYLHGEGKLVDAESGGPIEELVKNDATVLAVDLRGMGETATAGGRRSFDVLIGPDWRETTLANSLARPYVGMRVHDVYQCVRFLRERFGRPELAPDLIAVGQAGVPALHAAALEPQLFGRVRLCETIRSWSDVVETHVAVKQQANLVFGALRHYDLPNLVASLPPKKLMIEDPAEPGEATRSQPKTN